jgi:sugar lactone lactonase YvrE
MAEVITIFAEKIATGLIFGEGIRWTGSDVVLSDMAGRRVVKLDSGSGDIEKLYAFEGDNRPNGLVCPDDGSILILSMIDRKILRFKDGEVSVYADLSKVATGYLGDVVMDFRGTSMLTMWAPECCIGSSRRPSGDLFWFGRMGGSETFRL